MSKLKHPLGVHKPSHPLGSRPPKHPLYDHGDSNRPKPGMNNPPQLPPSLTPGAMPAPSGDPAC